MNSRIVATTLGQTLERVPTLSEIERISSRIHSVSVSVNLWNRWYLILVALTVVLAAGTFLTQFVAGRRSAELSELQDALIKEKDRVAATDSKTKDERIADALGKAAVSNEAAFAAQKDVENAKKDVAKAVEGQHKVEIQLAKQQERAATAESNLLQLKESLKDRTISEEQQKILIALLSQGAKGTVEVWWTPTDSDSYGLAKTIVDVFTKAGWPNITERLAIGGTGNGFFIAAHDHFHAPAYAVQIQNAFRSIGIEMNGFSKEDVPADLVQIYIGHKTAIAR